MNFSDYVVASAKTDSNHPLSYYGEGLFEEFGEVVGAVKKWRHHFRTDEWFVAKVREELGDLLWYSTRLAAHTKGSAFRADEHLTMRSLLPLSELLRQGAKEVALTFANSRPGYLPGNLQRLWGLTIPSMLMHFPAEVGNMSQIAAANIAKLSVRYADGFSPEASAARVDVQKS